MIKKQSDRTFADMFENLGNNKNLVDIQFFAEGDTPPDPKAIIDNLDETTKQAVIKFFGGSFKKEREELETKYNSKIENLLKDLQSSADSKKALEEKLAQIEEAKMTDIQKKERDITKLQTMVKDLESKLNTATESVNKVTDRYRKNREDNALRAAIAQAGMEFTGSSEDIKVLFRNAVNVNFVEEGEGDDYRDSIEILAKIVDKDGKEQELRGSPEEVFTRWISQPRYAAYCKSGLKTGGGSGKGYISGGTQVMSTKQFQDAIMSAKDEATKRQIYSDEESGKIIIKD